MATAITPPLLAARHIPAGISATGGAAIIADSGIATALCAALGVGVGAIIRNQAGAIIAVLALLYVAEPLLGFIPHLGTAIQQYGLGGLAAATTHTAGFPGSAHLGQPAATLILAGYAAAALLAGAALLRRRDITTGLRFPTPARPHNRQAEPKPRPPAPPGTGPQAAVCAARPQRLHIRNPRRAEPGITTWPPKPRQPGGHDTDSAGRMSFYKEGGWPAITFGDGLLAGGLDDRHSGGSPGGHMEPAAVTCCRGRPDRGGERLRLGRQVLRFASADDHRDCGRVVVDRGPARRGFRLPVAGAA